MQRSLLAIALFGLSAAASAGDFDYTYVSLGYGNIDYDDLGVDGDGFGVEGSLAVSDNFHVFAGYGNTGLDYGIDATTYGVGIGYNMAVSPVVDLVSRLSYNYIELDASGVGSVDDNGLGLGVGLRFAASEKLELDAGIDYIDYGDGGDDTAFGAGGLYNFTDSFALGLDGSWSDDASAYTVSGRFYFGK